MCDTCGCGNNEKPVKISKPGEERHSHHYTHVHDHLHDGEIHTHEHDHEYFHSHAEGRHQHTHDHPGMHDDHDHDHDHEDHHTHSRQILVQEDALQRNNMAAQKNRGYLEAKGILALNLVSSPGSGKTSLLEKTISTLKDVLTIYVIEGDQQTMNDANRIDAAGAPVVQINTGNGCHLDAEMVYNAMKELNMGNKAVLMIENVGNLVCPSLFDLGENHRVVIISVTEGDDKPLKYPTMFQTSDVCIINKTDLLPYVDFDIEKTREYALRVNPRLRFFEMSVRNGAGMEAWTDWLKAEMDALG